MLKEILGVKENFKLPTALLKELLQDSEAIIEKIYKAGLFKGRALDFSYFQTEHSDRNELKQDFTPECLCKVVAELTEGGSYLDVCAGVGGLSVFALSKADKLYLEEYSERAIPFLLLNLAFNNVNALVFQKDVLTGEIFHIYRLSAMVKYSKIEEVENAESIYSVKNVIMNPPYSLKWDSKNAANDVRFLEYGIPPNSKADYAFLLHGIYLLEPQGIMIAIVPHGLLFRGAAEEKIRQKLVENNLLDTVIGLPDKLFLNTDIPVCLMIFKKGRNTEKVLFIDSSKEFKKQGKQNYLTESQIEKIINVYKHRLSVDKYSKSISRKEIVDNSYNLNIPRYVDTSEEEEIPDLLEIMSNLAEIDAEEKRTRAELYRLISELETEKPDLKKGLEADLKRNEQYSGSKISGYCDSRKSNKGEDLQDGECLFPIKCDRGLQYCIDVNS